MYKDHSRSPSPAHTKENRAASDSPSFAITAQEALDSDCSSSTSSSREASPLSRHAVPDRIPFTFTRRGLWMYIKPAEWSPFGRALRAEFEARGGPKDNNENDGWYHIADAISLTLFLARDSRDNYYVLAYNMFRNMARESLAGLQNDESIRYLCNCITDGVAELPLLQYQQTVLTTLIGETASTNNGDAELYDIQQDPTEQILRLVLKAEDRIQVIEVDGRGILHPPISFEEEKLRSLWFPFWTGRI